MKHIVCLLVATAAAVALLPTCALGQATAAPSVTNTTNTTEAPTSIPEPTTPEAPVEISDVFTEDPDSADSTRGMALAALVVSALSGNFPNGIVATRSALFLSVCIPPKSGPQSLLQFPVVTKLGDEEDVQYWFGAAVFNPVVFVSLCVMTGGIGLLLAQVRNTSRRHGLSAVHYPAHLSIPLGVMIIPGMYSASVALSRSRDGLTISMATLFGVLPWVAALLTMGLLLQTRFRAVYVRRMETIDASGNVTTVRRRVRHDADEDIDGENDDGRSDFETSVFGGTTTVGSPKSLGALGGGRSSYGGAPSELTSGDSLTEKMLGSDRGTSLAGAEGKSSATGLTHTSAFLENARKQLDTMVARETDAIEKGEPASGGNDDEENPADLRKSEAISDAHKVAEVTDTVLRNMFSQAKRVGTDRLVLLYSVQGHFEWADDDEVDYEAVQNAADEVGQDYTEAVATAEDLAQAATGYVLRFGTFFVYYRRKFRLIFIAELFMSAVLAFFTGFHPSDDLATNCYIDTSALFLLFAADMAAHIYMRPHISKLNNGYFNTIAVMHCFAALMDLIAAASKSIGAARSVNVISVLLVYTCALRALLDLYVAMTQRLYEAGVEWPSLATLTDKHIKYQRKMRDDVSRAEAIAAADSQAHAHSSTMSPSARRRAMRAKRNMRKKAEEDDDIGGVGAQGQADDTDKSTAEKWMQLTRMVKAQGSSSRVVPETLLPFEMVPLPPLVKRASQEKTEAWERRRKEIKQRVKWASALQTLRNATMEAGGGGDSDDDSSLMSSSSSSSVEPVAPPRGDRRRPSDALSAVSGGAEGGGSSFGLGSSFGGQRQGTPSHGPADGGGHHGRGLDERAFTSLLKKADAQEQAKKRRLALQHNAAEQELGELEEGGYYTSEDSSRVAAQMRQRTGLASLDARRSSQHHQTAAATAPQPQARPRKTLGGDIEWTDTDSDAPPPAAAGPESGGVRSEDDKASACSDDFNDI